MKTCLQLSSLLLPFQLGACAPAERDELDAHLLDCRSCLGKYLTTKRDLEDSAAPDERPSLQTRVRVREDVARTLGVSSSRNRWPPKSRWIVGGALAAGLLAAAVLTREPSTPPPLRPVRPAAEELIDSDSTFTSLKFI